MIAAAVAKPALCEKDPAFTRAINVEGTLRIAEQLHAKGIVPIVFSTDYVFDGITGSYSETSPQGPLNEYGRQKTLLENKLPEVCKNDYLLIRLGKVYTLQKGDNSLLDEMAQLLSRKQIVKAAGDQIFNPIWIGDVVSSIHTLQQKDKRGCYHVCGSETYSRYDLAYALTKHLGLDPTLVQPISLDSLNESFVRPKNTSMSNCRLLQELEGTMTMMNESLAAVARHYQQIYSSESAF